MDMALPYHMYFLFSSLAIILQCLANPSCYLVVFSFTQQHSIFVLRASPCSALPPWPPAFVAAALPGYVANVGAVGK